MSWCHGRVWPGLAQEDKTGTVGRAPPWAWQARFREHGGSFEDVFDEWVTLYVTRPRAPGHNPSIGWRLVLDGQRQINMSLVGTLYGIDPIPRAPWKLHISYVHVISQFRVLGSTYGDAQSVWGWGSNGNEKYMPHLFDESFGPALSTQRVDIRPLTYDRAPADMCDGVEPHG
jgi:hypothetical protein